VEPFGRSEDAGDVRNLGKFGIVISDFLLPGEDGGGQAVLEAVT